MNYNELLDLYAKLETKYEQLTKECEELKNDIKIVKETIDREKGEFEIEEDQIFLLSIEEYNKYKHVIPCINCWWWLRSPHNDSNDVIGVYNADITCRGVYIGNDYGAVRPAIRYNDHLITSPIGSRFTWNGVTWVIIDAEKGIAIAEMPIGFEKFDDKSNNYATSYIRRWLLDWKSKHWISKDWISKDV